MPKSNTKMPETNEPKAGASTTETHSQQVSQHFQRTVAPYRTSANISPRKGTETKDAKKAEKQRLRDAKLGAWLADGDDRPRFPVRFRGNDTAS